MHLIDNARKRATTFEFFQIYAPRARRANTSVGCLFEFECSNVLRGGVSQNEWNLSRNSLSLSQTRCNFLNTPLPRPLWSARATNEKADLIFLSIACLSPFARAQTEHKGGCLFDEHTKKFEGNRKTSKKNSEREETTLLSAYATTHAHQQK